MTKQIHIRSLFLLSVSVALLSGCTKDATNIKLPETPPKLVVGCFISPQDTILVVTLSRSNPIFGADHNNINNLLVGDASIIISNDATSITIPYNSINEQYELQSSLFPIVSGQTYSLTISTPKGENVSASCTVPASNLTSLTVDFMDTASYTKKINVKWQDIPNQVNYYRIAGQVILIDLLNNDTIYSTMYNPDGPTIQTDAKKEGQEMSISLEGYGGYYYENPPTYITIGYDIYLLNIDAEYYKYQNSLDHYTYADPFSEPSPLYTNIKGGLGIFAAYQKFYVRKN